jgi:hypothetical protein
VIGELANAAEAQKAGWIEHSWNGGACDPVLLNELKTRADAYRTLAELSYEDYWRIAMLDPISAMRSSGSACSRWGVFRPMEFNIVVELDPTEEVTKGGIILPNAQVRSATSSEPKRGR